MYLSKTWCWVFILYINIRLAFSAVFNNTNSTNQVKINKCCEKNEIYIERHCTVVNQSEEWRPLITSDKGRPNLQINYR